MLYSFLENRFAKEVGVGRAVDGRGRFGCGRCSCVRLVPAVGSDDATIVAAYLL